MWIANYSMEQIRKGKHFDVSWSPTILIQIKDPELDRFVISPQQSLFKEVHQFSFLDIEEENAKDSVTNEDIQDIADILTHAKSNNYNVIVHCHAGICRSGAIAEAGRLFGFDILEGINKRIPNLLVLRKLRTALGLTFSWE